MPQSNRFLRFCRRWPWFVVAAVALAAFAYIFIGPLWAYLASRPPRRHDISQPLEMTLTEAITFRAAIACSAAWVFMFGASIGSFLNVVVYRTPRGKSITWSPSRCPYCATRIAARDNIPVFGWLLLRGRCRTCRMPISARYPIVETLVGVVFLSLASVELLLGGVNLPGAGMARHAGLMPHLFDVTWRLVGVTMFHCFVLVTLLGWALIRFDRQAIPRKFAAIALAIGIAAPAMWPNLWPLAWRTPRPEWTASVAWIGRIDTGLVGLFVGAALGAGLSLAEGRLHFRRGGGARLAVLGLGFVGLCLGWQAALSVAAIAVALGVGATRVFLPTWLHLCAWSSLYNLPWWPGSTATIPALAISLVGLFCVTLLWRFRRRQRSSTDDGQLVAASPPTKLPTQFGSPDDSAPQV